MDNGLERVRKGSMQLSNEVKGWVTTILLQWRSYRSDYAKEELSNVLRVIINNQEDPAYGPHYFRNWLREVDPQQICSLDVADVILALGIAFPQQRWNKISSATSEEALGKSAHLTEGLILGSFEIAVHAPISDEIISLLLEKLARPGFLSGLPVTEGAKGRFSQALSTAFQGTWTKVEHRNLVRTAAFNVFAGPEAMTFDTELAKKSDLRNYVARECLVKFFLNAPEDVQQKILQGRLKYFVHLTV